MNGMYPDDKKFALAIIDDTDVSTLENVKPIYDLFFDLGLAATKTVWPIDCPEGSENYSGSQTLDDTDYREFVQDLVKKGFEVTWHGATMESSPRERTIRALETFHSTFGFYPRIHVNHGYNRENIYWGSGRIDSRWLARIYELSGGLPANAFSGHDCKSPYWWGDYCESVITYARNLSFNKLNLERINPSMPYVDPRRPLVPRWFSTSDAGDVIAFNSLISLDNQQRLENERGFTIISTHFGKGFVKDGRVDPETRALLENLASRPGWFVTAGKLLDWLCQRRQAEELPKGEWASMQRRWLVDLLARHLVQRS